MALSSIAAARRELSRRSHEVFARAYLPHHVRLAPSRMHREMFALLHESVHVRPARLAIAAPRGHAKTTVVTLAHVLFSICHKTDPFIVLVSNTGDQAEDLLSTVKHELESNDRLFSDFPEVAEPLTKTPPPQRWRKREIITRNGVKVMALGAGQKIRGRKHREHRPTLIILDDIENEAEVASAEQRENKREWFEKSLLKAGVMNTTNVIVVGTILHYDSLLSRLVGEGSGTKDFPGWTARRYQAVLSFSERRELWEEWESLYAARADRDGHTGPKEAERYFTEHQAEMLEGTDVLWPERESYRDLMEIRVREGRASFDSEKQNEPVDPSTCYFRAEDLAFWDDRYKSQDDLLADLGKNAQIFGACDPSLGRAGRLADDTAILSILFHTETSTYYVLDADIQKRKPRAIIETILEYHRIRKFRRFAIEVNQFQDFLATELKAAASAAKLSFSVHSVNHTSDKLGRIQSLEPLITSGRLRFSHRHHVLIDQLRQFPKAAHDDGPDALEMAIEASRVPQPGIFILEGGLFGPARYW